MIPDGEKFDSEKDRWDLLPMDAIEQVVKILTYGAKKYADNNWQKVEPFGDRYYAALMRHLVAHRMGEKVDPESGQLHIAHATCNAIFLLWNELNKNTQK
jgi:hypothetical protein